MGFLNKRHRERGIALFVCLMLLAVGLSCSHLKLDRPVRVGEMDWPTFARNGSRTGVTPETIGPPLTLAWVNDVTGAIGSGSPLVVDSLVIIGTLRGELHVLNALTGKRKGWIGLCEAINGSPVVGGDVVYVAASNTDESLIAYDMRVGKLLWRKPYGDIEASPLLAGEKLYFGNTQGEFYSVERSKGEKLWKFALPENNKQKGIRSSAAIDQETVIFGSDDGSVYALDAGTGILRWQYSTEHPIVASVSVSAILLRSTFKPAKRTGKSRSAQVCTRLLQWLRKLFW